MSRSDSGSSDAETVSGEPAAQVGLVSRWEQRKQRVREESQLLEEGVLNAQEEADSAVLEIDSITESADDSTSEAVVELTDADMPPIDSLHEDSDFSGFMSPKVSDELRRLALRKLFQASSFNVCDGLDDYDEDFTQFEKLGDIITSDMKHQWEVEARKRAEAALAEAEQQQAKPLDAVSDEQAEGTESLPEQDEGSVNASDDTERPTTVVTETRQQNLADEAETLNSCSPERNPSDVV